ncbi:MAG: decarboxylase [Symploca sp. SIO2B6]|nr:decarboxylase [Symploca sp. SIO2B6]
MVSTQAFPTKPFSLELAEELLTNYGSPLYIYQHERLQETIAHITQSIPYPFTKFHFASVTNGNLELLRRILISGWGLHANTPGDIYLGLTAGFPPQQIVYSGSNLNRAEMEQVLKWGTATLNLDSVSQLDLCCQVYQDVKQQLPRLRLGLRLNLPELTAESRIGVRPEEFPAALKIAKAAGLKLSGLHFYRGTGTSATKAFTQVIEQLLAIGKLLPDWEYLDFGGGFGYPYHADGVAFDWQDFGRELTKHLNALGRKIELIIEPGRAAIAGCGTLLATVVSVKWQSGKQILGVDTTVANLSVPSVHGGYREIATWADTNGELYLTDVCGNTTYSRDYLGRNCQLPALQIGDVVAILDVGAYGYAMSSHFLHRPRPPEVLLEGDRHRLIRQREDYSILLNNQLFA